MKRTLKLKGNWSFGIAIMFAVLMAFGCSNSDDDSNGNANNPSTLEPDIVISLRIDDTTGFLNMADLSEETNISNTNGLEVASSSGVYANNGYIYTTGSMDNDKIAKYELQENNILKKIAETNVYESGGSIPTCLVFVNNTKAYLALAGVGELLSINLSDLSVSKRIDISGYAMDTDGETDGDDTNPEASGGVIRDGKLYLGLGQIDSFETYQCCGKASVLIIDTETDEILKHITDDRTCTTGAISPNHGLILDENGDIYVNNTASFGYYPGYNSGFLRIKNGEDDFDPDYYFSITDLEELDVPGGVASYAYNDVYLSEGKLYTSFFIPALTSNPPDYANDRNYQPYLLDLHNKTATKLDMLPTIGWSTFVRKSNNTIVYALTTENGAGLYRAGESNPFITTEGTPFFITNY